MQNPAVANTYLNVSFKDKDAAKALGARWDGLQKQWFVPPGRELAPFAQWLPKGAPSDFDSGSGSLSTPVAPLAPSSLFSAQSLLDRSPTGTSLTVGSHKGLSLSSLLAGVSQAVAQVYRAGVWTLVEVVELRTNGGHVFMGVSERDASGSVLAKTSAVIWQSTANTILPEFERATGAQLAPGIKLLVRARPVFKPLHGFSIEIDAIDPEYTLGDLEARKREIRERLQAEGVFTANKQLPPPGTISRFWWWHQRAAPAWEIFRRRPTGWSRSGFATLPTSLAASRVRVRPRRLPMHCRLRWMTGRTRAMRHQMQW